jgi:retron-type reverse transcriptase
MTVEELQPYLREHWLEVSEALDQQTYKPSPVRRVEIPKPDGGMRILGIPNVSRRGIKNCTLLDLLSHWRVIIHRRGR